MAIRKPKPQGKGVVKSLGKKKAKNKAYNFEAMRRKLGVIS